MSLHTDSDRNWWQSLSLLRLSETCGSSGLPADSHPFSDGSTEHRVLAGHPACHISQISCTYMGSRVINRWEKLHFAPSPRNWWKGDSAHYTWYAKCFAKVHWRHLITSAITPHSPSLALPFLQSCRWKGLPCLNTPKATSEEILNYTRNH